MRGLKPVGLGATSAAIDVFVIGLATGALRLVTVRKETFCTLGLITCPTTLGMLAAKAAIRQKVKNLDCFIKCSAQFNSTNVSLLQTFVFNLLKPNRFRDWMPRLFIAKIHLAGCNPRSEIYNLRSFAGVLAQLVERLNGIEEVTGSNPVGSIYICSELCRRGSPPVTGA